jgi:hypothetical protein
MAESTNITNSGDWRAQMRATELEYDKYVFSTYRAYRKADAVPDGEETTEPLWRCTRRTGTS